MSYECLCYVYVASCYVYIVWCHAYMYMFLLLVLSHVTCMVSRWRQDSLWIPNTSVNRSIPCLVVPIVASGHIYMIIMDSLDDSGQM